MMQRRMITLAILLLFVSLLFVRQVHAESCEDTVRALNARLSSKIDEGELIEILRSLDSTNNKRLPLKFLTKKKAQSRGWKPGKDLWSVNELRGSSIGGDRFNNLEGRLPERKWREADLDYKGGPRGAKRLVFSRDGQWFVTVDHYKTFVEVPACR